MKPRNSIIRRVVIEVAIPTITVLSGIQLGCVKPPQAMLSANSVPASQGTVKATAGDNGNTRVYVRVKHLAPPSRMESDSTVYVVWIQPRNAEKQNIGALTLNANLEGSLDTMTPHRQFQIMVTPEPSGQVAQPTHEAVFTSDVERTE